MTIVLTPEDATHAAYMLATTSSCPDAHRIAQLIREQIKR